MTFNISVTAKTPGTTAADLRAEINDIFNSRALDLADKLQRESPVGATGELKAGWDVVAARRLSSSFDTTVSITNSAEAAEFRIRGRAPGKFPPSAPIEEWVRAKLNITDPKQVKSRAFLIRRKIARQGTDRWKTKQNILGLDRSGNLQPGSPVEETRKLILQDLKKIKLVKKSVKRR